MAVPAPKAAGKKAAVAKREPNIIQKGIQYLRESWAETKRATWPSWLDVRRLTIAVFAGVITVGLYVYVLDTVLALLTRQFLGTHR